MKRSLLVVALGICLIQLTYAATVSVPSAAADGIYVAGQSARHPGNAALSITRGIKQHATAVAASAVSTPDVGEIDHAKEVAAQVESGMSQPSTHIPVVPDDSSIANVVNEFAGSHSGTYKVALTELSGSDEHISIDGDVPITTASTYKLFVAYSTILSIEAGNWSWTDVTSTGQDVATCFDLMIEDSDNDSAIALLQHLGNATVQADAAKAGATNTVFLDDDITSTANDEALLLSKLETGTLPIAVDDAQKWLSAMEANEYRDGIPAGLSTMVVADKVGFLDELLHDAAIVYSPKGTYVLVVLTDGATWPDIAALATQIEASR